MPAKFLKITHLFLCISTIIGVSATVVSACQLYFFFICWLVLPLLLLVHLIFLIFWKKNNLWLNRISIFLLLIGVFIFSPDFSKEAKNNQHANPIRLLSYNIDDFRAILKDGTFKNGIDRKPLEDFAKQLGQVDILCAQEVSFANEFVKTFNLPNAFGIGGRGTALFTRFPILNKGELDFPKTTGNAALWADLQLPDSSVLRVYSVHLQSYKITPVIADLKKGKFWKIPTLFQLIGAAVCERQSQAKKLLTHAQQSPYPTIFAGDFNSLPQANLMNLFDDNFQNFFTLFETGWGKTYVNGLPHFRLDYIFCDDKIQPLNYEKIEVGISDHYPVLGEFLIER